MSGGFADADMKTVAVAMLEQLVSGAGAIVGGQGAKRVGGEKGVQEQWRDEVDAEGRAIDDLCEDNQGLARRARELCKSATDESETTGGTDWSSVTRSALMRSSSSLATASELDLDRLGGERWRRTARPKREASSPKIKSVAVVGAPAKVNRGGGDERPGEATAFADREGEGSSSYLSLGRSR